MLSFGTGQGYLKAGFLGFNKSGKTHTAMLLALELRKRLNLKKPLALFDTEAGGEYIAPRVKRETGLALIGVKARSMLDLLTLAKECEAGAADILIVDSITHPWRELCQAYFVQINKAREAMRKPKRTRLEFPDWAAIKERWGDWTDFYLNSKLHIAICGRAGFEWDFQDSENADGTTRKELVKTGVKMKVESEFGFEPSLLVEMERLQVPDSTQPTRFKIVHRATVLGDRFDVMDGKTIDNPTGEWFAPHLDMLTPGASNVVDVTPKTDMGVDEAGDAQFQRERRDRTKLCEEIQGEIVKAYPGQSAVEKRAKMELLEKCCGTKSWTAVEGFGIERLRGALADIRLYLQTVAVAAGKEE